MNVAIKSITEQRDFVVSSLNDIDGKGKILSIRPETFKL